jgi:hypothetical protein
MYVCIYIYSAFFGLNDKLYHMHGMYTKMLIYFFFHFMFLYRNNTLGIGLKDCTAPPRPDMVFCPVNVPDSFF